MNEIERILVSAHLVDARGKACPMPIIELAKALRSHDRVELWADDPAARGDLNAFLSATGHTLIDDRSAAPEAAGVNRPRAAILQVVVGVRAP